MTESIFDENVLVLLDEEDVLYCEVCLSVFSVKQFECDLTRKHDCPHCEANGDKLWWFIITATERVNGHFKYELKQVN